MSALAQIAAGEGNNVSGSDRDFDRGRNENVKNLLEKAGVKIYPQDGSAINSDTLRLVVSTAIEDSNPEVQNAEKHNVEIMHRSQLLAEYVNGSNAVVVSGTSGKSTVVAMVFDILEKGGLNPSVITGGALNSLKSRGLIGNAYRGKSDVLIVEGDESDGSLTRYKSAKGITLNITRDHKTLDELKTVFTEFKNNCGEFAANGDDPICREIFAGEKLFGFDSRYTKISQMKMLAFSSEFLINDVCFNIPVPGKHNIENALAASVVAEMFGIKLAVCAEALKHFKGVERRFNLVGQKKGVFVIDDFAHNPAKISSALDALHHMGKRVFAVYQPHGFTPTKNLRKELVASLTQGLTAADYLLMPEIYYAGGTVNKNISSADIVNDVKNNGKNALFFEDRKEIPKVISEKVKDGDVVCVMGARDSSLTDLAKEILRRVG